MIKNNGCCDLKYAQELKELGVKQDSLFYWVDVFENLEGEQKCWQIHFIEWFSIEKESYSLISAFTVTELVEDFPDKFEGYMFGYNHEIKTWWVQLPFSYDSGDDVFQTGNTLVNAIAETKIWLIKHKRLEVL